MTLFFSGYGIDSHIPGGADHARGWLLQTARAGQGRNGCGYNRTVGLNRQGYPG
jgi:hypothetical protein